MKILLLRKMILIELTFFIFILMVLGVSNYGLLSLYENYQERANTTAARIATLDLESRQLQDKFSKAQKSLPVYEEIVRKNQQAGFSLNREVAQKKFDVFKDRYHLAGLRISMTPVQEAKSDEFKRKTAMIISNEVSVKFESVSDEDIFALFQDLPGEMSGAIRLSRFSLTRLAPVTNDALLTISQKGNFVLTGGEFKFVWLGMKSIAQPSQKPPGAPKDPADAAPPPRESQRQTPSSPAPEAAHGA